ncbi:MAG: HlyC/CorC family transporter [Cryomorphaceae bacterium]|nr:MAG: HlyC/CorC family transporter [Cryomorphaceae bacterium]
MELLILLILLSITLSAFFSGMEIAFVSANKLQIELEVKKGSYGARIISGFMKNPGRFISSMLVGNNITLVVYGILMGRLVVWLIFPGETTSDVLVMVLQTIISALIILVTGEFLPKALFRINPNAALTFFALPVALFYYLLYLPSVVFTFLSEKLLSLFSIQIPRQEAVFGRVDLDEYVKSLSSGQKDASQLENELEILKNALDFRNIKARDCMVPRPEIEALEVNESINTLRLKFIETGYSKVLIYRDSIDHIIGYVHCNELFNSPQSIKSILMPLSIVPETITAREILQLFIKQRRGLAVVVDEHGGTSGMITMEDIVEEIFGEIEDEHDQEDLVEEKISEHEYRLSARLEVDYLNEKYQLNIPDHGDYDTLAGFILNHIENIPKPQSRHRILNFDILVTKVSSTRIEEVLLRIKRD